MLVTVEFTERVRLHCVNIANNYNTSPPLHYVHIKNYALKTCLLCTITHMRSWKQAARKTISKTRGTYKSTYYKKKINKSRYMTLFSLVWSYIKCLYVVWVRLQSNTTLRTVSSSFGWVWLLQNVRTNNNEPGDHHQLAGLNEKIKRHCAFVGSTFFLLVDVRKETTLVCVSAGLSAHNVDFFSVVREKPVYMRDGLVLL